MKNYDYILNQNNNNNLICEGYLYNKENRASRTNGWRCVNRKCKSIGSIDENDTFISLSAHTHQADEVRNKKLIALNKIKQIALTSGSRNLEIITEVTCE